MSSADWHVTRHHQALPRCHDIHHLSDVRVCHPVLPLRKRVHPNSRYAVYPLRTLGQLSCFAKLFGSGEQYLHADWSDNADWTSFKDINTYLLSMLPREDTTA
jgi:hypothetical protein